MRFRDDTRGVTVQVGAVLLFATLIIALSVYQATVVPSENADVEYRHSQQVQGQLVDVRNALVATGETGAARPATVSLGTEYPNRVFLVNPPPAAGTLRTDAYDDPSIEVANVNATNPETRDYLDGSWAQPTKSLTYVPGYNEYRDAPRLRYEASLLSNYYPEQNTSVPLTDQLLVDSETRTVSLVALNGSLSTSRSSSVAVSPTALSAPAERVQVQAENPGQPVNVTIPTVVDAGVLRNSTSLGDNPDVTVVQNGTDRVTLSIDWSGPFTLQTAKVGVGSDTTDPAPHYLTVVESDDDSVTVEARDAYNNPESGVTVSVDGTNPFESASQVTGEDGRATFEAEDGEETTATLAILGGGSPEREVDATVDTTSPAAGNGSGGSLVYLGDGTAFDGGDDDTNPGGFNFSVANTYGTNVSITDVTVLPEDDDTYGLSDEASGYGPGQSELHVASENTTEAANVEVPLFAGDQYAYVGARGLTLSLTENREEEIYDSGGNSGTITTNASGGPVELDTGHVAEVTFAEFYDGTTPVNVTDDDFRVVVTYERDGEQSTSEFVVYAQEPDGGDDGGGAPGATPEVSFRLDDLSHPDQSRVDYVGSYSVSNTNSSFERVEVEYENTADGSATQTLQKAGERGGLRYTSSYGAGQTYDVTVRVIYSDGGSEYVAASQTVTDEADALNPGGNDDLSTGSTATLDASTIEDRSSNGQGPRYRFSYTVSGTGGYSQTELVAVATGSGDKASTTRTTRSGNNVDVSPGYGYQNEFKVAILVYGPDGAVVDDRILTDDADGTGP